MTKEQFDRQQWHKGMKIRNAATGAEFEVVGVDFSGKISFLIHDRVVTAHYKNYEAVEERK